MELRGSDGNRGGFLSLGMADSSLQQLKDSSPPLSRDSAAKTHDFLRPLEQRSTSSAQLNQSRDVAVTGPARRISVVDEPVDLSNIVTCHFSRVADSGSRATVNVIPVTSTCVPALCGPGMLLAGKTESDFHGSAPPPARSSGTRHSSSPALASRGCFSASWGQRHRSSSGFMEAANGDDTQCGDCFACREPSAPPKESSVRGEAKQSCNASSPDQRPNSQRSRHSATEQRRRSKINDRFQTLRGILPHIDQKRDTASFLLEVIEYIRLLQEKVHKYEALHPDSNHDSADLMLWKNVYFRSLWSNAENKNQTARSSGCANLAAEACFGHVNSTDTSSVVFRSTPSLSDINYSVTPPDSCRQVQSSSADKGMTGNAISEGRQDPAIDEETLAQSTRYSQRLLAGLSQALKHSGVDLSRTRLSVDVNLRKRAADKKSIPMIAPPKTKAGVMTQHPHSRFPNHLLHDQINGRKTAATKKRRSAGC